MSSVRSHHPTQQAASAESPLLCCRPPAPSHLIRRLCVGLLVIAGVLMGATILRAAPEGPEEVLNFMLIDQRGTAHELRRSPARVVVLFFTGNDCPVVQQYSRDIRELREAYLTRNVDVWMVNSVSGDDRRSIEKEARKLHVWQVPVLKDDTQGVARHLKVRRTAEVIAIDTATWKIFYRGAIDDRLAEGAQKPAPTRGHLREALDQFLAGKPVTVASTPARGCVIHFEAQARWNETQVSYSKEIAPLLLAKCVDCHSPGNIGRGVMRNHKRIKSMSAMIEEVLLARRMPPWDPDPAVGRFSNAHTLTTAEAQTLLRWVEQGSPRGDGPDPLETASLPEAKEWPLGQPDIILRLPEPQKIPATGTLDYRHVEVAAGNAEDAWVGAIYVKPGNKKVVHHVIARLKDGGLQDPGGMQEMYAGWAPGTTQEWFPKGIGKRLPKQARFDLELHYTTCGTEETDSSEIGLYLLKEPASREFQSYPVMNFGFEIPPGVSNHEVHAMQHFDRPATLYSVTPHMHVRGKWMKFQIFYPDGRRETVCSVPRYDFNWQQTYMLDQPRVLPAGTWVQLVGGFDNSTRNPSNPDPTKPVRWGEQSWEEMFLGWFNVAWEPSRLSAAQSP